MIGYVWVRANTLISDRFKEGESFKTSSRIFVHSSQNSACKVRSEHTYRHIWFLWVVDVYDGEMEPQDMAVRLFPGNKAEWKPTRLDLLFDDEDDE